MIVFLVLVDDASRKEKRSEKFLHTTILCSKFVISPEIREKERNK